MSEFTENLASLLEGLTPEQASEVIQRSAEAMRQARTAVVSGVPAPGSQAAIAKLSAEYKGEMDAAIARGAGSIEKRNIRAKYSRLGVNVDTARGGKI